LALPKFDIYAHNEQASGKVCVIFADFGDKVMMPRSLTAVAHVTFNYQPRQATPVAKTKIEMVSRLLDQAAHLSSEEQEILVKFADCLNRLSEEDKNPY